MRRSMLVAYTFVLMNWAAVVGLYHFVRGHKDVWHRHKPTDEALTKNRMNLGVR